MNENNGHQFVPSRSKTGNPPHVGLSDNITLLDGGLTTNFRLDTGHQVASHPSNVPEHELSYRIEIAEQLKSEPKTNSRCELHHRRGIPTPQIPAFSLPIFPTPVLLTIRHPQKQALQLLYVLKDQQTEVWVS